MSIATNEPASVIVIEDDPLPQIVGVPTAIPAFVGYTERAEQNGKSVAGTPVKITSLADYERIFGAGFHATYNIEEVPQAHAVTFAADGLPQLNPPTQLYDFTCARKDTNAPSGWTAKFYKFSLAAPALAPAAASSALAPFLLYNAIRLFYANGGGFCYIVSAGLYVEDGVVAAISYVPLKKGLDAIAGLLDTTILAVPDAVALPLNRKEPTGSDFYKLCQDMLNQCSALQDRVAILDVYGAEVLDQHQPDWEARMTSLINEFRTGVGDTNLGYGMPYFPFLTTSIVGPDEIDYTNFNVADQAQLDLLTGILNDQAEFQYWNEPVKQGAAKAAIAQINTTPADGAGTLNQTLVDALPLLRQMENIIAQKMSLLPPSAAMAGVFSFNDATRGVWSPPAGISLHSVSTPNIRLNDQQQSNLTVPDNGKSINAIRYFIGRGSVVWGARTLDGNNEDWRYIQVRRLTIYIEQSIKRGLRAFVLEANDEKTWAAATSSVSGFLEELWQRGGLIGPTAKEAFSVACGLGTTMTQLDILNGYLNVQVEIAPVRPAEFIVLEFQQKVAAPD